jgi:Asp-tRNA(Asn)/Glu-tRNA(Gln) amidotransferase A subunit family amidase
MSQYNMLSARAIALEISAGRLKPREALQQGEQAIDRYEDRLHIFAHRPDKLVVGKGPLSGIAVGVKDVFDTNDMPTRYGSKIYPDHQPASDASLVTMLKNSGATIAGKTVTTEFAWFTPRATRNPHNPAFTPGGSSSGSAAGVAAGFFPASIGTQTGGSIIRPAAFCGVSGYKPSYRLFPTVGLKQFSWLLDTVGFFAASAADVAFVAQACSGRDLAVDERTDTPPRLGIYKGTIDHQLSDDMVAAIRRVARRARANGAHVAPIRGPKAIENARAAHASIQGYEARLSLGDELSRNAGKLSKKLRDYLRECGSISPDDYDDARRTANRARKACHDLFDKCDVLLLPSAPGTAPRTLKSTGDPIFNQLWTLMGLPCVNVCVGTDDNNLPIGLQVIAPFGQDKRALQAAHWLEQMLVKDI